MVGKKTIGWGLSPVTWHGWFVTIIFLVVVIFDFSYFKINDVNIALFILALIIFILITLLTGKKPGSKQFNEQNKLKLQKTRS